MNKESMFEGACRRYCFNFGVARGPSMIPRQTAPGPLIHSSLESRNFSIPLTRGTRRTPVYHAFIRFNSDTTILLPYFSYCWSSKCWYIFDSAATRASQVFVTRASCASCASKSISPTIALHASLVPISPKDRGYATVFQETTLHHWLMRPNTQLKQASDEIEIPLSQTFEEVGIQYKPNSVRLLQQLIESNRTIVSTRPKLHYLTPFHFCQRPKILSTRKRWFRTMDLSVSRASISEEARNACLLSFSHA
jgi:hypothetical protein